MAQFSFSDLVSKLISEEVRQKDSSRIEEATALHVGRRKEKTKFGKKGWNSQRKNDTKVQCYNCGKRGHYARDCRARKRENGDNDKSDDHSNVAFNVTEGRAADRWIMDSGATAHMCKDRAAFVEYTKTTTARNVFSAKSSAQLKVLGQGTVISRVWNGTSWINVRL